MRTRRTPAPHPSRPRAASLRRVVAAALALPLTLGTLAATALPAAADQPFPGLDPAPESMVVGDAYDFTIACPNIDGVDYNGFRWTTIDGSLRSVQGTVVDGVKYSAASIRLNQPGEQWIDIECLTFVNNVETQQSYKRFPVNGTSPTPVSVPTQTAVTLLETTVNPYNPILATATVEAPEGRATGGTVQFTLDGEPVGAPAGVDSSGLAQATIPNPGPGKHKVGATYLGTPAFETSSGSAGVFVQAAPTVSATVPARVTAPATTLSATVTGVDGFPAPTGTVTFRFSEGARLGDAPVVDGTATLALPHLAPGYYPEVIAVYSGDATYGNAGSKRHDMTVDPAVVPDPHRSPSDVKVSAPATAVTGSTVEVKVTVHPAMQWTSVQVAEPALPTGTVIIELADGAVKRKATLVDGVATFSVVAPAPGTYTIEAHYYGDEIFEKSQSSTQLVVTAPVVTPPVVTPPVVTPPASVTPDVTVPATVTTSVATQATFTVGFPGKVRPVGALTVSEGATTLVSSEVPATGDLAVTLPVLSPGTHDVVVRTSASKGVAATEQPVRVTVLGEPAKATPTPDADLTGSTTTLQTGKKITLVARDFLPGETVAFYLHSDPVFLGTAVADENGVATLVVALPAGVPAGAHHVQATGGTSGRWAEIPVTVTEGTPAVETPVAAGPIVTVPVAAPVAPAAPAPAVAAPAAPVVVTAAPLAATGAETGSTALLVSVLLGSGALLLAGRRRFTTSAR